MLNEIKWNSVLPSFLEKNEQKTINNPSPKESSSVIVAEEFARLAGLTSMRDELSEDSKARSRVAEIKQQIQTGQYQVDFEKLSQQIAIHFTHEF